MNADSLDMVELSMDFEEQFDAAARDEDATPGYGRVVWNIGQYYMYWLRRREQKDALLPVIAKLLAEATGGDPSEIDFKTETLAALDNNMECYNAFLDAIEAHTGIRRDNKRNFGALLDDIMQEIGPDPVDFEKYFSGEREIRDQKAELLKELGPFVAEFAGVEAEAVVPTKTIRVLCPELPRIEELLAKVGEKYGIPMPGYMTPVTKDKGLENIDNLLDYVVRVQRDPAYAKEMTGEEAANAQPSTAEADASEAEFEPTAEPDPAS